MVNEISKKRSKEAVEEDVQRLRDWLGKQPHLPHDVEHELLLAFVNGTKTLEGAKRKLDAYFSNRNKATILYNDVARDVNDGFKEKSRAVNQFFFSNLTPEGYMVCFLSANDCFSEVLDHPHELTRLMMMLELGMIKWSQSTGLYLVMDCSGVPSSVLTSLSPSSIMAALSCYQDGYPIRLKGAYFFNAPTFIEFVVNNFGKPVMKPKLFDRIKVTAEGDSYLKQYIPLEMLPSNYGGKDKSSEELNEYWFNQLEEKREWFLLSTKQVSDEKKRPPDSKNTFGIDGTFRKLAVD